MNAIELSYFERRAEAELQLAQEAVHPAAVKAHYMMADHYLDRLYGPAVVIGRQSAAQPLT